MFITSFTGNVKSIEITEEPGTNGQTSKIAEIRFTVTVRKYNKQTQKTDYINYYCSARAYDKLADRWANYERNQIIEGIGRFEPRPYINKETGEPAVSFNVYGVDSFSPMIDWVPRPMPNVESPKPNDDGPVFGKGRNKKSNELEIENDDDF